jgi:quinolinate synthase
MERLNQLKEKKNTVILAHVYQKGYEAAPEQTEIAGRGLSYL